MKTNHFKDKARSQGWATLGPQRAATRAHSAVLTRMAETRTRAREREQERASATLKAPPLRAAGRDRPWSLPARAPWSTARPSRVAPRSARKSKQHGRLSTMLRRADLWHCTTHCTTHFRQQMSGTAQRTAQRTFDSKDTRGVQARQQRSSKSGHRRRRRVSSADLRQRRQLADFAAVRRRAAGRRGAGRPIRGLARVRLQRNTAMGAANTRQSL